MNLRYSLGSLIWVVCFSLSVAFIAIYWGLGWAISILCLRHILMGIPLIYIKWREILIGTENASKLPELRINKWPNTRWVVETIASFILSILFIVLFNIPLDVYLFLK
jgi:hypothetical protein